MHFHFHIFTSDEEENINRKLNQIMATQQEDAAKLQTVAATLDKISAETSGLLAEVQALKDAAANAGEVSPKLQAAIDAVGSRADAIDALVPDAAAPPTP